ncbi:hypothetical protein QNI19_37335 [Cytophagaceae bacterium DM2B3-1]|uniref:Uncharacterized protein n=1 Tax=Xanthocytophaga flava TaxID=3048013 RepID=A0ABT7CYB7_9BACT|nr:hypothetical protein [Xanthocytophaga flavus]MDJ1498656.1 hypothetical protein [Xanthocytophaga flavus]
MKIQILLGVIGFSFLLLVLLQLQIYGQDMSCGWLTLNIAISTLCFYIAAIRLFLTYKKQVKVGLPNLFKLSGSLFFVYFANLYLLNAKLACFTIYTLCVVMLCLIVVFSAFIKFDNQSRD